MDWKRGLTRLYVVLAVLWVLVSGLLFILVGATSAPRMVASDVFIACLIVVLPPAVLYAVMRALFCAIEGFSSDKGDA